MNILLILLVTSLIKFSYQSDGLRFSSPVPLPKSNGGLFGNLEDVINTETFLLEELVTKIDFLVEAAVPKNCLEVQQRNNNGSNIYLIKPKYALEPFNVYCDMDISDGGWTYLLTRIDGSQGFYQDWNTYKEGFGDLKKEFWLGLEKIHLLTGYEFNELLIELVDWDNNKTYAHYDTFSIGNEQEGYNLKFLDGFSGDAGDSLTHELGMKFTTKDKDQDVSDDNCAVFSNAAWWYRDCKWGHLTGRYLGINPGEDYLQGIYWVTFHPNTYSMKEVKMMVRPKKYVAN